MSEVSAVGTYTPKCFIECQMHASRPSVSGYCGSA